MILTCVACWWIIIHACTDRNSYRQSTASKTSREDVLQLLSLFWQTICVGVQRHIVMDDISSGRRDAEISKPGSIARYSIETVLIFALLASGAVREARSQLSNEICLGCHGNQSFSAP